MQQAQQSVDHYFESSASYWDQLYSEDGLVGSIYQHRRRVTLEWIRRLYPSGHARVLDVGCGAGCATVPLAESGYSVVAVDRLPAMLQRVQEKARWAKVAAQITTVVADACALEFPDVSFDVTLALGLLPWLNSPERGLGEMVRVTKPGGHIIVSADNSLRLNYVLDPLDNPLLAPLRRALGRQLRRAGLIRSNGAVDVRMHSRAEFDSLIRAHRLRKIDSAMVGFGPFTLFRRELWSEGMALRLNNWLQTFADKKFPMISAAGAHYLVLALKPATHLKQ